MINRMKNVFLLAVVGALFFGAQLSASAQKLKAEEVVAKHLQSIGTPIDPAPVKNRVLVGNVRFKVLQAPGEPAVGKVVMASENDKMLLGMSFNMLKYPHERMSFDGERARIAFISPGSRSPVGDFIYTYNRILHEGLIGGVLSQSWSLSNLAERKPKLEYDGTRKVNNREAHVLRYELRKGSDLQIKMYFDAENFRHLRTEYRRTIAARQGADVDASARQNAAYELLIENFSDFAAVNGLNLPGKYHLHLTLEGQGGAKEYDWHLEFTGFAFNQQLDANAFNIEPGK